MLQQALKSYAVYKPYYIFDAVYTPKETRLLREAAECGATVVSGLEMFIRQAMGQFEHFTGMPGTSFCFLVLSYSVFQATIVSTSYINLTMTRRTAPDRLIRDIVLTKS
jgi:shikimate 5-dehydrogenase